MILISQFRERLVAMSGLFDYDMRLRDLTQSNLLLLEGEVREIYKHISTTSEITNLLASPFKAQVALRGALTKMNLAADVFDMPKTIKRREQLYQLYAEISKELSLGAMNL